MNRAWKACTAGSLGALALVLASSSTAEAHVLPAALVWEARFSSFKGDTRCAYGSENCDRCAYNIESTFRSMTQDGHYRDSVRVWNWERARSGGYQPSGRQVNSVFSVLPGTPIAGEGAHFQGFARVASDMLSLPDLVASYGGDGAGVFVMNTNAPNGGRPISNATLSYLRDPPSSHPAGLTAVGHYVIVPNDGNEIPELEIFNVQDAGVAGSGSRVSFNRTGDAATVGAARLRGGGYLLVVRNVNLLHEFYYTPSLVEPRLERIWVPSATAEFPFDRGPDGMSLTTECGTGDIYATLIGADRALIDLDLLPATSKDDVWSLSRLNPLRRIDFVTRNTRFFRHWACDTRAAASMFVGRYGELAMYCHQKGQDIDHLNLYGCAPAALTLGGLLGGIGLDTALITLGLPPVALPVIATTLEPVVGPFSPFLPDSISSCIDGLSANTSVGFTEYWSAGGTPEAPLPGVSRTVTLRISGSPATVRDAQHGWSCTLGDDSTTTCLWKIADGDVLSLYPTLFPSTNVLSPQWTGGPCATGSDGAQCVYGGSSPVAAPCSPTGSAYTVCKVQVKRDMTLDLKVNVTTPI